MEVASRAEHQIGCQNRVSQCLREPGLNAWLAVYQDACRTRLRLNSFGEAVAQGSGAELLKAPLKKMWRCLEKMAVKYTGNMGPTASSIGNVKDIARIALQGNMGQLAKALRLILEEGEARVVRVKNRFQKPSTSGWADCQIMLCFLSDASQHICEIQLVHHQLMVVRHNMGGHREYVKLRSASELLTFHGETLPDQ